MSEELRKPSVIDLEALLSPISEEAPSGESLRYSGLYDEVAEARRADDNLNLGEWQTELKVADYRKVKDLVIPALSTQTKDLQLAVWLCEALVRQDGFVGLRDSLDLLRLLHEHFWETLHPEIDEGDMEGRANAISWFESTCGLAIKSAKITGSAGYSYLDWEDSKVFDIPEALDSFSTEDQVKYNQLREQAERERRVTADMWRKEWAATRRAFAEELNFALKECFERLRALNTVIDEKYDRNQVPSLTNLKKSLDDIESQAKKLLEEKRAEEPDESDQPEGTEVVNEDGTVTVVAGAAVTAGAIQNRRDALKRLDEIAEFFRKTEPHSPVAYLVQRAVKWGHMPLENWLQDVIKDETILYQLRQTLGFNTAQQGSEDQTSV
ncbi:MAG: type VI secretion system protein TssA [Acidobacteria bacterium]|nr:type VI secretion system protein TssA [Acidobacteriota bacterium]